MPASSRRTVAALLGALALALALPGLPAVGAQHTVVPASLAASPPSTTTRTGGATQLSDDPYEVAAAGAVLYDSHTGAGTPFAPNQQRTFGVATTDPATFLPVTPPDDATAAILNVTAVSPTRAGWLSAWASDAGRPVVSTLNFAPGTPTANLAVVRLSATRKITIMNGSLGSTHVVVSLRGWVRSNGGVPRPGSVNVTTPRRVVDTRTAGGAVPARGHLDVKVTGPRETVSAGGALLDIIAVKPSRGGYLIAHPSDTPRPASTALTYRVGGDRAALSLMRLSSTGTVRVWNMSSAPVHLVIDSFGSVVAGDGAASPMGTSALTPTRLLDTRTTTGGALDSGNDHFAEIPLPASPGARSGFTPSGAVLAITATGATRSGHLDLEVPRVFVDVQPFRTPSILDFGTGETVTNTTYVTFPATKTLRVHAATTGSVHVVIDLVGLVSQRGEYRGRVVNEADGTPLYPAAAGDQFAALQSEYRTTNAPDGSYRWGYNLPNLVGDWSSACATAMTVPGSTTDPDPRYAPGCIGGAANILRDNGFPNAFGAITDVGDVPVPKVGTLTGSVSRPDSATGSYPKVYLTRTDGKYDATLPAGPDGTWTAENLPVGDWLVAAGDAGGLVGETVDEIPRSVGAAGAAAAQVTVAGAKTSTVSPGASTATDPADLKVPGTLAYTLVDPDRVYTNISLTLRHESGYTMTSSAFNATGTRTLRPGRYSLCATESGVTRCNGGGSDPATAPLLDLTSGAMTSTTVTVP